MDKFLFDEAMEDGIEEGKVQGRIEGKMEGKIEGRALEIVETGLEYKLTKQEILERLQKKLDISLEASQAYLDRFAVVKK